MAGPKKDECEKMADKYVEARLAGKPRIEARTIAGYSEKTHIRQIERKDGPVANKMSEALEKRGITEEMLAQEYAEGLAQSKQPGAKNADYASHAKYLFQLGTLLGYGRKEVPAVAVQINNGASEAPDSRRLEELAGRLEGLLGALEEEIGSRGAEELHEGDPGAGDSKAHL